MSVTPHPRLLVAAAAWTALAVAAVVWPLLAPLLALTGGVAVALVALDAWRLRARAPLSVSRELPERAFVERDQELGLVLENTSNVPVLVEVFEELPSDLADPEPSFAPLRLGVGERRRLAVPIRPRARGERPLGRPLLLERSPLGLLRRRVRGPADPPLRVVPDTARILRTAALEPRDAAQRAGVRPVRQRGEGIEFESLRDWVPGDDPRRLDWAASARRGRPVVRRFQHERHHTVLIALDTSRLMAGRIEARSKLDFGVDAALALACAGLAAGDRVGMALFDRELRGYVTPRRSRGDLGAFVELLRGAQPRIVEADFRALARGLGTRQRQRALLIVITDFVEAGATAFTGPLGVLAKRHRVLLVAVRDRLYRLLEPQGLATRDDELDLYRRIVLDDLLRERETALGRLRRQGLQTLDLAPERLTAAVLNRYLSLRTATTAL